MLRRLAQTRRLTLPNGRTFLERVNIVSLYPTNARIKRTYTRKISQRRQRKPRKNIIRGRDLGKRAANTEVGRMIVDDIVGLILRGYKVLKNKLFKRKTTTTTPFDSHQPVQKLSCEGYQPLQISSPEGYQPVQILSPEYY